MEDDVKNLQSIESNYALRQGQDGLDHHNYQGAISEISRLRFVKMLRDFEESSEYENMYN